MLTDKDRGGVKIVGLFDNPFEGFIFPALITLGISLFSQWIFTNWKIKREFRIQLLKETFNPLYEDALELLNVIKTWEWRGSMWQGSESLPKIMSDVRFVMLKKYEQRAIKEVYTALKEYLEAINAAGRMLWKCWGDTIQSKIRESPIRDNLEFWFYTIPDPSKAEDRLRKRNMDQEHRATVTAFKATQEYQTYIEVREKTLPIVMKFKENLTKWSRNLFRLVSL